MPTVFEVLLQAARNLEAVIENTASADGSTNILYDNALPVFGYRDDDFIGGSIFLKTNLKLPAYTPVTNEPIGSIQAGRNLYNTLLHKPVKPSSVTITGSVIANLTDDGKGKLVSAAANVDYIVTSFILGGIGQYPFPHSNLVPGTVKLYIAGTTQLSAYDDSEGQLLWATNGYSFANIDYDTGVVTLTAIAAGSFDIHYTGTPASGTIDYQTGAIALHFSLDTTDTLTASYQWGYATFLPIIARVTDFTSSTGKITFGTSLLLATTKGDQYGMMHKRYPAHLLRAKLNEVLRGLKIEAEITPYIACSTIANSQLAWTETRPIRRIEYGRADATNRDWRPVTRWALRGGILHFFDPGMPTSSSYVLRVTVVDVEAEVNSDSAEINDKYPLDWLALEVAVKCARWRLFQAGQDDKALTVLINDLMSRRDQARARAKFIDPQPLSWQQMQEWPEY